MGTQSQRYVGKGNGNNRVFVDYESQTVKFEPAKYRGVNNNKPTIFFVEFMCFIMIGCLIGVLYGVLYAIQEQANYEAIVFSTVIGGLYGAVLGVLSLILISWNNTTVPELMERVTRVKELLVLPENVANNQWVLPLFGNVILKYKTTGDFSKLKNITINNISYKNEWRFYALFKWKEKIKNGFMKIQYS